ncbi:GAF domain-containing sensor histidine kinase [Streptomyces alkaliphilus]|uniref:GAF domain-containing sensor histidine kinase n=1 Tax=Streptomyces alkaliphilus TaxID=1472722 RepID=UPI001180982E|nr:GAF domain-containing protein [Streptomyces alkaliphilus]MQS09355.1 GAF domain-containing protein [Streptomyces alkaliphilus]
MAETVRHRPGGRSGAPGEPGGADPPRGGAPNGGSPELSGRIPRLLRAMVNIGGDVELHTLLDRVTEAAADLVGARYIGIGVLDEEGGVGELVTRGVERELLERMWGLPHLDRRIARMLESPRPVLLDDMSEDPRYTGLPGPDGVPAIRSLLGAPIRVHGAGFGALYLGDPRAGVFSRDDLQVCQILATEAGIAIGNARLYEAVRQRARWMDGSAELSTSLLSGDGDNALAVVAEQARRLADADAGLVLLPDEAGGLVVVAVSSTEPMGLIGAEIPPGGWANDLLLSGEPAFVEHTEDDPWRSTHLAGRYGPNMLLPLGSDGKLIGVLSVPRAPGAPRFTFAERAMATQFAQQAALALLLTEARRDREQLAVYADRDRIARDLHDLVIQRLFATGMLLESAGRAARDPGLSARIGKAVDELDATIQEIRTAIFALQQGPEEAPTGLRTRVLRETGTAARSLGFQPSVSFVGPVDARVGDLTAKNMIAAIRETLSNVARHAGASRVEVVVDVTEPLPDGREVVRLTVTDDGVGLPPEGTGRRSGLVNLRRRAESLGGGAEYGPGPDGRGASVRWWAPPG